MTSTTRDQTGSRPLGRTARRLIVVELPDGYAEAACRAARLLGLNIAGVDLLEGNDGPLVLEVNSSPGLEGIEGISNKDIAGKMIEGLEKDLKYSHKGS